MAPRTWSWWLFLNFLQQLVPGGHAYGYISMAPRTWSWWLFLNFLQQLALLGGDFGAEIFGLEDLADFQLGVAAGVGMGAFLGPVDGFLLVLDLPDPEAGDELFGFGEWAVRHNARVAD